MFVYIVQLHAVQAWFTVPHIRIQPVTRDSQECFGSDCRIPIPYLKFRAFFSLVIRSEFKRTKNQIDA